MYCKAFRKRLGETGRDWERLGETGRDWERLGETGRDWELGTGNWELGEIMYIMYFNTIRNYEC